MAIEAKSWRKAADYQRFGVIVCIYIYCIIGEFYNFPGVITYQNMKGNYFVKWHQ